MDIIRVEITRHHHKLKLLLSDTKTRQKRGDRLVQGIESTSEMIIQIYKVCQCQIILTILSQIADDRQWKGEKT